MQKFAVIVLFFLFACNQAPVNVVEKPSDLIPEEKMVKVLVDVHLLEATLNVRSPQISRPQQGPVPIEMPRDTIIRGVVFDPNAPPPIAWYDIFKKHGVTKAQYEASMKWYSSQPEELNKIYDEVINELTTQQVKDRAGK